MKNSTIVTIVTAVSAMVAISLLAWWLVVPPSMQIDERLARELAPGEGVDVAGAPVVIEGELQTFDGTPSSLSGQWREFRGPGRANVCNDGVQLADTWPADGPAVIWSVALGEGYAGPAIANGCVYVMDYDGDFGGDALRCFSFDDGKEIWRRSYKVKIKRNHGMSRTVPAVSEKYVVAIGPKCHVMCANAITGAFLWGIDLAAEYKAEIPMWYTGQCPLIDDGVAVIAPGGGSLMIGVDCATGKVLWRTPNPHGWQMSHSSIMPMTFAGRAMYVYCAVGGVVGVDAEGDGRGQILWETSEWNHKVVSSSPTILDEGRILVTAGYGAGSMMLRVTENSGTFSVAKLYEWTKKVFSCEQHTPIFYKGHLFSVLPSDAGAMKKMLVCLSPDGEVAWTSGKDHRFGLGPFLVADDKMFILSDDGELTMARATTDRYDELASAPVLDGREAWAPIAIADGRMLVRDFGRMVCLDVRAK